MAIIFNYPKKGFKVFGLDINKDLVNKYKKNKKFKIYFEYHKINFDEIDIIIIALPTPLKNKSPDLSCLKQAVKLIYPKLSKNTLVVLESTSYPSTTNEILVSKIKNKFTIGKDFSLVTHLNEKIQVTKVIILKIFLRLLQDKLRIVKN